MGPIMKRLYFNSSLRVFLLMQLFWGCGSRPAITLEKIKQDIIGDKTGYDIIRDSWTIAQTELKQITIVESNNEGDKANILVDIKTADSRENGARRLRLYYKWNSNEWSLGKAEYLTSKLSG
jgi:hypothetical protein